jgi:hypothetical protein
MAECHQDRSGVAVTVAIIAGYRHQSLDLTLGQVFAGTNCPVFRRGRRRAQHGKSPGFARHIASYWGDFSEKRDSLQTLHCAAAQR